jgi:hypothetical protein
MSEATFLHNVIAGLDPVIHAEQRAIQSLGEARMAGTNPAIWTSEIQDSEITNIPWCFRTYRI